MGSCDQKLVQDHSRARLPVNMERLSVCIVILIGGVNMVMSHTPECHTKCWPSGPSGGIYDCTRRKSTCVQMMRPGEINNAHEIRLFDCSVKLAISGAEVTQQKLPVIRDRYFHVCPRK